MCVDKPNPTHQIGKIFDPTQPNPTHGWIQPTSMSGLYAGPSCTICQFWLFAGQCKSIADIWKLLYIFGSKVAICVGYEFD